MSLSKLFMLRCESLFSSLTPIKTGCLYSICSAPVCRNSKGVCKMYSVWKYQSRFSSDWLFHQSLHKVCSSKSLKWTAEFFQNYYTPFLWQVWKSAAACISFCVSLPLSQYSKKLFSNNKEHFESTWFYQLIEYV